MKAYSAYKPSPMPWLDKVPAHWGIMPAFSVLREKQHKNKGMIENTVLSLSYGNIVIKPPEKLHGLVPESFETYQIVDPQNIIIRPTDLQNDWTSLRVGLSRHRGIITSAYICLKAFGEITPEYAYLLLHTYDLLKVFYGMGSGLRQNLGFDDLRRMPVLLPSLDEQRAIVSFLDSKLADIDRYIAEKERLIELLQEQKIALINQSVTHGLNPKAKMKSSGIDWLEEVPEHWEISPLDIRYQIQLGKMLNSSSITGDFLAPYLRNTDVQWDNVNTENLPQMDFSPKEKIKYSLKYGDLLVCEGGEVGRTSIWRDELPECYFQKAIHRLRPYSEKDSPKFLFYLMYTAVKRKVFVANANSNTFDHLTVEKLRRHRFAFPPKDEQIAISELLDNAISNVEFSVSQIEKEILLVQEYRTALIAEAVTGKIDVRS